MQAQQQKITPEIVQNHGLKPNEYDSIVQRLGREPNLVELGMFSAMWSEHCSYKSTKVHLKKLYIKNEKVICGPGEGAGIVDIGDNQAVVFKMESHNHPSFIEPFQGAATGVGGILRDVFSMGARPIANINSLRFGDINHPKTKYLLNGVVSGISFYGNCVGIPMLSGQASFHPSYNGNNLVNAMSIGLVDQDKIFYSKGSKVGHSIVYIGSKTGRDGIHGASMSSSEFDDEKELEKPTVQRGDPFMEKLLLEASIELMDKALVVAVQDMGAAGLTCASVEMASKAELGIEMNLDLVPKRETGMSAYEIMLSESQERMIMVIEDNKYSEVEAICKKWQIDCAKVGKITDTKNIELVYHGEKVATIPITLLVDDAPEYNREYRKLEVLDNFTWQDVPATKLEVTEVLEKLLATPDLADKSPIYEQYDSQVGANTVLRMPASSGAIAVTDKKALACTTSCTPSYVKANPYVGTMQAVAKTYRALSAIGAEPIAITNCLNFGNPEKPEIMGQIVSSIEGMRDACKYFDYPVVSGNVSMYNETSGNAINPTPAIGGVGVVKDFTKICDQSIKNEGDVILLIGESLGHIGQSLYLREIHGLERGDCPFVNLIAEKKNSVIVRELIQSELVNASIDVGTGGMLVSLSKMLFSSSLKNAGADVTIDPKSLPLYAYLFGEDQARFILTCSKEKFAAVSDMLANEKIPFVQLGQVTANGKLSIKQSGKSEEKTFRPLEVSGLKDLNKALHKYFAY